MYESTTTNTPYMTTGTSSSCTTYYIPHAPVFIPKDEHQVEIKTDGKIILNGVDVTEELREITEKMTKEALKRQAQKPKPRPNDLIELVSFNKSLDRTTVKWKDGTITYVHCAADDELDLEKAIAMCFMKKAYDNRGCFNEFLKKWVENVSIHE